MPDTICGSAYLSLVSIKINSHRFLHSLMILFHFEVMSSDNVHMYNEHLLFSSLQTTLSDTVAFKILQIFPKYEYNDNDVQGLIIRK